jgi:hypothetical protein
VRTTVAVSRTGGRVRITCTVSFRRASSVRVALRLVRAGRTFGRADLQRSGRVQLRLLCPPPAGRYTLVTVVTDGTRSRHTRRAVVVPPVR